MYDICMIESKQVSEKEIPPKDNTNCLSEVDVFTSGLKRVRAQVGIHTNDISHGQ